MLIMMMKATAKGFAENLLMFKSNSILFLALNLFTQAIIINITNLSHRENEFSPIFFMALQARELQSSAPNSISSRLKSLFFAEHFAMLKSSESAGRRETAAVVWRMRKAGKNKEKSPRTASKHKLKHSRREKGAKKIETISGVHKTYQIKLHFFPSIHTA